MSRFQRHRVGFILIIILSIYVFFQILLNLVLPASLYLSSKLDGSTNPKLNMHFSDEFEKANKIVIATVACSKTNNMSVYEETAVMIKSVILSARMNFVTQLEFYIFLELNATSQFFIEKFKEFGVPGGDIDVQVYFYSAFDAVPIKYRRHMIAHKRFRCAYVRTFFPSVLPMVDSVLYFDTDVIITGDIRKIWTQLSKMNKKQMLAIGRNNEPEDKNYGEMDERLFGDIPHVPPKGINNGVIAMNLTRLRKFKWVNKFIQLYEDSKAKNIKKLTVQRLMNILLYYNPELVRIMPCQYNFIHTHCTKGPTCKSVEGDPIGIHLIHGANSTFERDGIFYEIFKRYDKFNMTRHDFYYNIVYPIRKSYSKENPNLLSECYGYLDKHLYKNVK